MASETNLKNMLEADILSRAFYSPKYKAFTLDGLSAEDWAEEARFTQVDAYRAECEMVSRTLLAASAKKNAQLTKSRARGRARYAAISSTGLRRTAGGWE